MKRPQSGRASLLHFSSPLFFFGFLVDFLGSTEGRRGPHGLYRGGEAVARWGGDRPPCRLVGGGGDRHPRSSCRRWGRPSPEAPVAVVGGDRPHVSPAGGRPVPPQPNVSAQGSICKFFFTYSSCHLLHGRQAPYLKFYKNNIYFWIFFYFLI